MRTFLGSLIGCVIGFMLVPILIGLFADTGPNAIDGLLALIFAGVGAIVGAMVGSSTGRIHERRS